MNKQLAIESLAKFLAQSHGWIWEKQTGRGKQVWIDEATPIIEYLNTIGLLNIL